MQVATGHHGEHWHAVGHQIQQLGREAPAFGFKATESVADHEIRRTLKRIPA